MRRAAALLSGVIFLSSSVFPYWVEAGRKPPPEERKEKVIVRAKEATLRSVLELLSEKFGIRYVIKESKRRFRPREEERGREGREQRGEAQGGRREEVPPSTGDLLVTFYYEGTDGNEAVRLLCQSADVYCYRSIGGIWYVEPYETLIIEKSFFFDYSVSGSLQVGTTFGTGAFGGQTGNAAGVTGGVSFGGTGSGDSISFSEKHNRVIEEVIRPLLSDEGKVVYSPRGYVMVIDRPSRIREIRRVLRKEQEKERPIRLRVRVVRVDLRDEYSSGIDWSSVLRGDWGRIGLSVSTASIVEGPAGTVRFTASSFEGLLNLLSRFGDVTVVKSWDVKARSGIAYFFNVVEQIPFFTQSIAVGTAAAQVGTQVNYTDVGLKIKILPEVSGDYLEGGIYVEVSEFLGFETVTAGQGDTQTVQKAPRIARTSVAFPLHTRLGETTVISGFKTNEFGRSGQGVPFLSKLPLLGYLFGYREGKENTSELLIVITPEDARKSSYAFEDYEYIKRLEEEKKKVLQEEEDDWDDWEDDI